MRTVPLHGVKARGRFAFVSSDRDYDLAMGYRWTVKEKRRLDDSVRGTYAMARIRRSDGRWTTITLHQLITGCTGIDHRNGYGLDCTRWNLRKATGAQNSHNQGSRAGTSRFKGVSWYRWSGKWRAAIMVNYRKRHLGYFVAEDDAARAYDAAALKLHGEFARLNFPQITTVRKANPVNLNPNGETETDVNLESPARSGSLGARLLSASPMADPHAIGSI